MTNNQLIEEDFEREITKDLLYLYEREREIEEEYYEYITRLPAEIIVIHEAEKIKEHA